MLQTAFLVALLQKMMLINFHQKFCCLGGVQLILVYDVAKKGEKNFFAKHWQVTYQQMQNGPLSHNLLIVLVY